MWFRFKHCSLNVCIEITTVSESRSHVKISVILTMNFKFRTLVIPLRTRKRTLNTTDGRRMITVYIHKCTIDFCGLTGSYIEFFYSLVVHCSRLYYDEWRSVRWTRLGPILCSVQIYIYIYICVCVCVCVCVYMYKNRTGSVGNWTISKVSVEVSATFSLYFTTNLQLFLY